MSKHPTPAEQPPEHEPGPPAQTGEDPEHRDNDALPGASGHTRAARLRRDLEERGLKLLAVSQDAGQPDMLSVHLHGAAGQWVHGYALSVIRTVPDVLSADESPTTPTIIRVHLASTRPVGDVAGPIAGTESTRAPGSVGPRGGYHERADPTARTDPADHGPTAPPPAAGTAPRWQVVRGEQPADEGDVDLVPAGVVGGASLSPMTHQPRPADALDVRAGAALAAEVFEEMSLAAWLVPDTGAEPDLARAFRVLIEHALKHGHVDVATTPPPKQPPKEQGPSRSIFPGRRSRPARAPDQPRGKQRSHAGPRIDPPGWVISGLAVWTPWPRPAMPLNLPLFRAAGFDTSHLGVYLSESLAHHPSAPGYIRQHQLSFLAVHPDHRRAGIADLLLSWHGHRLDHHAMTGYVECPEHLHALFEGHGYRPHPGTTPFRLPDGTHLTPMLRPPERDPDEQVIDLRT